MLFISSQFVVDTVLPQRSIKSQMFLLHFLVVIITKNNFLLELNGQRSFAVDERLTAKCEHNARFIMRVAHVITTFFSLKRFYFYETRFQLL